MSIGFSRLLEILLVTTPCAVVLYVLIWSGGCVWPISSRDWRAGMDYLKLMNNALSSASADDDMTVLIILATANTTTLLGGSSIF